MTRRSAWRVGVRLPPSYCGGPTGDRLMLKRQREGESMVTPAQVEAVIAMLSAAHPNRSLSTWDILREVMDDGLRSLDQRLEQSGPLEPNPGRFAIVDSETDTGRRHAPARGQRTIPVFPRRPRWAASAVVSSVDPQQPAQIVDRSFQIRAELVGSGRSSPLPTRQAS